MAYKCNCGAKLIVERQDDASLLGTCPKCGSEYVLDEEFENELDKLAEDDQTDDIEDMLKGEGLI